MIAPAMPKHIFANLFILFYSSDFLNPNFSNKNLDGQNLVHTPICNIVTTNNTIHQFCRSVADKSTRDISK